GGDRGLQRDAGCGKGAGAEDRSGPESRSETEQARGFAAAAEDCLTTMLIGVISDTHGLLRPEALVALAEAEHILHAGDVGNIEILAALSEIAPVTAIRGNVDTHGPCALLPATEAIELRGRP